LSAHSGGIVSTLSPRGVLFRPLRMRLATSDWYFNPEDHRSPHDAWLSSLHLTELSSGERHEIRALSLRLRLLGAYHAGYIELLYPRVFAYLLNLEDSEMGHHDWRYDELRVSDQGRLIHEIEWCCSRGKGRWLIEASDAVVCKPMFRSAKPSCWPVRLACYSARRFKTSCLRCLEGSEYVNLKRRLMCHA
jgi:hypothetical protein